MLPVPYRVDMMPLPFAPKTRPSLAFWRQRIERGPRDIVQIRRPGVRRILTRPNLTKTVPGAF
jgi:hypothetical protein